MTDHRLDGLAESLRASGLVNDGIIECLEWRSGLDYFADLVVMASGETAVLKSPKLAAVETSYSGRIDLGRCLWCEAEILTHVLAEGITVPPVRARLDLGRSSRWLLLDRWDIDRGLSDMSDLERYRLGELVRKLHDITSWPAALLESMPVADEIDWVRSTLAGAASAVGLDQTLIDSLLRSLRQAHPELRRVVGHLDLRGDNAVVTKSGEVGLLDFSASRYVDRLMELGLLMASGSLEPSFLHGYGTAEDLDAEWEVVVIYALAAACRRVILFRDELNDEVGVVSEILTARHFMDTLTARRHV